jgi:16S rRNA (guanine527-N7)-methyltransferase
MPRIIADQSLGSTTVDMPADHIPPQPDELKELLSAQHITATDEQLEKLDLYRRLLWSWNERMNLTRHTTLEKFVGRDVVDSYELSKLLEQGERVLDVGTGGGVPGIVIAILRSDLTLAVCDSTQKKARAVEAMVADLGLPIRVFPNRAEEVLEITTFDTLVARGLAPLAKVLTWLKPHWDAFDRLLLIKGRSWVDERAEARHLGLLRGRELRRAASYQTPGNDAESVILSIRPGTDTD